MNYFTEKAELQDVLTDIGLLSEQILDRETTEVISRIKKTLKNRRFPIVLAGRFSTGKSLLLNRLFLDDDLLPSKVTPTTARNILIEYGDEKAFCLQKVDDGGRIQETKVTPSRDAIAEYSTHMGARKDEFERFVLKMPLDVLKNGVTFIDTVGTEDIDDHYVSETINSIKEAAVVIYVTNALQPLAQSETMFLLKHLSDTPKKLFLVANKIDGRPDPEDRKEILDDLTERFRAFYAQAGIRGDEKVFLVSAKTEEGLPPLRDRILEFVGTERVKELVLQCASNAKGILDREISSIDDNLKWLLEKQNGQKDQLIEHKRQLEGLKDSLSTRELHYEELKNDLKAFAERELENALDYAQDHALNTVANREIALQEVAILVEREIRRAFQGSMRKIQARFIECFEKRLPNFVVGPVSEKIISDMQTKMFFSQSASGLMGFGGVGLVMGGILQGVASSEVSEFSYLLIPLFFKTTSWSAAAAGALPFLVPGILVTGVAAAIYAKMKSNKTIQTRVAIQRLFDEARANRDSFADQIDAAVNQIIEDLGSYVYKEIRVLKSIIEETRPQIIEKEIEDQKLKRAKIDEYAKRLFSYIENAKA